MSERLNGKINEIITLTFNFTKYGDPADVFTFQRVEIYDSYDKAVQGNPADVLQTINGVDVDHVDVGVYEYDVGPFATPNTYYDKVIVTPEEGEPDYYDINAFIVAAEGAFILGEMRKGYAFGNPDHTANSNWGAIITPDELRYVYGFGNELVAPNSQTITDETLQWYINNSIASVELDLKIKLYRKVIKYREIPGRTRDELSGLTPNEDFLWEEAYDFEGKMMQEFIYIKLRKRL